MGYPMRSAVAVAVVLAAFYACGGGFTSSNSVPLTTDSGINSAPSADSGSDAGDAGDAGAADAGDAGCPQLATGMAVFDQCANNMTATASVARSGVVGCAFILNFPTTSSPCTVAFDAGTFSGNCAGTNILQNCTATALPGTLHCAVGNTAPCDITFCAAGLSCP
jgi:hypothetical protein